MRPRVTARDLADSARARPYAVAVAGTAAVGVALILTGIAVAAGATLAGLAGVGILVALYRAVRP
jgi:hypothetical protein